MSYYKTTHLLPAVSPLPPDTDWLVLTGQLSAIATIVVEAFNSSCCLSCKFNKCINLLLYYFALILLVNRHGFSHNGNFVHFSPKNHWSHPFGALAGDWHPYWVTYYFFVKGCTLIYLLFNSPSRWHQTANKLVNTIVNLRIECLLWCSNSWLWHQKIPTERLGQCSHCLFPHTLHYRTKFITVKR